MPTPVQVYSALPTLTDYDPESIKAWILAATQNLQALKGALPGNLGGQGISVFITDQADLTNVAAAGQVQPPIGTKSGDLWIQFPVNASQTVIVSVWRIINQVGQWVVMSADWGTPIASGRQAFQ